MCFVKSGADRGMCKECTGWRWGNIGIVPSDRATIQNPILHSLKTFILNQGEREGEGRSSRNTHLPPPTIHPQYPLSLIPPVYTLHTPQRTPSSLHPGHNRAAVAALFIRNWTECESLVCTHRHLFLSVVHTLGVPWHRERTFRMGI